MESITIGGHFARCQSFQFLGLWILKLQHPVQRGFHSLGLQTSVQFSTRVPTMSWFLCSFVRPTALCGAPEDLHHTTAPEDVSATRREAIPA